MQTTIVRTSLFTLLFSLRALSQTLVFDSTLHDFGELKQREKVKTIFTFTNKGRDTVRLLPPRPTCGCTAALLSDAVLPPGKSGSLSVEFTSPSGTFGLVEKTVEVYRLVGKGQNERVVVLTVRANVIGDVKPDTMLLHFDVTAGDSVHIRTGVTSVADEPIVFDNISAAMMEYIDTTSGAAYHADRVVSSPVTDFTLRITPERIEPGGRAELTLDFATRAKGQINGHVRIALPKSEIRIPVVGVVRNRETAGTP
ncbi:MAG: DUF1573 domain-containing protein [Bacteroidota bacterium]|nr:DUF1573 domain-containing protein [Bacteroidota bacterium]